MVGYRARCCSLLVLVLVLNLAWAQDRSRSRFTISSPQEADEADSVGSQEVRRGRRISVRRTTAAPSEESSNDKETDSQSLPSPVQPNLEESLNLRHAQLNPTTPEQSVAEISPATSEAPPAVPTEKRKRPKKRRRPKTQPKLTTASILETTENPRETSSHSIVVTTDLSSNSDVTPFPYLQPKRQPQRQYSEVESLNNPSSDNKKPEVLELPNRGNGARYNAGASAKNSEEPGSRVSGRSRTGHRRSQFDRSSSAETIVLHNSDLTLPEQEFPPQVGVDRLPVEEVGDQFKSNDLPRQHSPRSFQANSAIRQLPPSAEEQAKDHGVGAATSHDYIAPLQFNQGDRNKNRAIHRETESTLPNVPLSSAERSLTEANDQFSDDKQPSKKLSLEHSKLKVSKHDVKTVTKYSAPLNRLPDPIPVSYSENEEVIASDVNRAGLDSLDDIFEKDAVRITSDKLSSEPLPRSLPYEEESPILGRTSREENRRQPNNPEFSVEPTAGSRFQRQLRDNFPPDEAPIDGQIQAKRQVNEARRQRSRSRPQAGNSAPLPLDDDNKSAVEQEAQVRNNTPLRSRSRFPTERRAPETHNPQTTSSNNREPANQQRSESAQDRNRSVPPAVSVLDILNARADLDYQRRAPESLQSDNKPNTLPRRNKPVNTLESTTTANIPAENQLNSVPRRNQRPSLSSSQLRAPRRSSRPQYANEEQEDVVPETSEVPLPRNIPEYQTVRRTPQRQTSSLPNVRQPQPVESEIPQRPTNRRASRPAPKPRAQDSKSGGSSTPGKKSDFQCPDEYGLYPDDKQCDKYYECDNDTAVEKLCPDGLAFNLVSRPGHLRCDSTRDVDCSSRPELQPPQPTRSCPRRYGLFADQKECNKFIHCVDGVATKVECPAGLVYDDSKGTCNWADLVESSCKTEDLIGFKCPEVAGLQAGVYPRYPHPDDCQLHFTCIKGADGTLQPRMLSCTVGLVYDPETTSCTRPENVPGCEEYYGKPTKATTRKPTLKPVTEEEEFDTTPAPRNQRRRRPAGQRSRS